MISSRRAFNRHTTAKHKISLWIEGYYDETNNYVGESWSEPKTFSCTPIPYGDRDSGIGGQKLMATDVGERYPAFMKVHSRTKMPLKSLIYIYGIEYKVIELDNYEDSGFYKVIAAKTLEE
jgi:hypothetical protein